MPHVVVQTWDPRIQEPRQDRRKGDRQTDQRHTGEITVLPFSKMVYSLGAVAHIFKAGIYRWEQMEPELCLGSPTLSCPTPPPQSFGLSFLSLSFKVPISPGVCLDPASHSEASGTALFFCVA